VTVEEKCLSGYEAASIGKEYYLQKNIMKILSNTTIHEEFINDKARQQLFPPYQPSSGHKYKNAECVSVT
jgi:hypothetical protein